MSFRSIPALSLLLFLPIAGCDLTGPGDVAPTWTEIALDEQVTSAYTTFGFDLFRHLQAASPDENIFVSPTSAAIALSMTYNGAVGQTAEEMAIALGIAELDRETVNETNRRWLEGLRDTGDPEAELAFANSIWHRADYPLLDAFRDRVQTYYEARIEEITTAGAINSWVADATRGRIEEVIDGIPGDVVAYLINALYFKADWTEPFDQRDTRDATFERLDGSPVQVPMMSRTGEIEMRQDPAMRMVRLPYGAERFSMILALPEPGVDLAGLADLLDAESWARWMTEFVTVPNARLSLPRFEVEWEASLVEPLHAMGMVVPFEPGAADLSAMFEARGLWIDDVFQKAYLRVDEKGTEAAAVTVVVVVESAPPEIAFDRPFWFAIYDHATGTILFLGQVTDPS